MNKTFLKFLLFLLSLIALILFCVILYKITISPTADVNKLLVPIGVLISAGLASVSVMNSIANTNEIEQKKNEKEHKQNITYFTLSIANTFRHMRDIREILRSFLNVNKTTIIDFRIFKKHILSTQKEIEIKQDKAVMSDIDFEILEEYYILINMLEDKLILKILENIENNNELSIPSDEYSYLVDTIHTSLSNINTIIRLTSSKYLKEVPSINIMFNQSYTYYKELTTKELEGSTKVT